MNKMIVFDLDGTLIDSVEDLAAATNYALDKRGFKTHEVQKYYHFVGDGVINLVKRALPESRSQDEELVSEIKSGFDEYYSKNYAVHTKEYNGITEAVKEIEQMGYILCVVSNKPDVFAKTIVGEFFKGIFKEVVGNTDKFNKKPAPDTVLYLMDKYSVDSKHCTIIGDSDVDIITAKNAGVRSVGAAWGFRGEAELISAGADFIAHSPNELPDIVKLF